MPQFLIVDDSPFDSHLLKRIIERTEDRTAQTASSVEQALEILESNEFDCIVSDLKMPHQDGLQLLQLVKERSPQVPVIIVTSQGSEELAVAALQAGAASYVPKQCLARDLPEVINMVLASSDRARVRDQVLNCITQMHVDLVLGNDRHRVSAVTAYLLDLAEAQGIIRSEARTRIGVSLEEALSNAVIHGNLEVSSKLRERDDNSYNELIEERRKLAPYADRKVYVTVDVTRHEVTYTIRDEGPGFDVTQMPDPDDIESILKPHGRGLLLIRSFMDDVYHNPTGNQISLVKRRPHDGEQLEAILHDVNESADKHSPEKSATGQA